MKRVIKVDGEVAYVPLTKGHVAVIDACCVPLVEAYNWTASEYLRADGSVRKVYAQRKDRVNGRRISVYMHRAVLGAPASLQVDHVDSDGLNNRKENLRSATPSQNQHNRSASANNTSGFKGVDWMKKYRKWRAQIGVNGRRIHLGVFDSAAEAGEAYAKASAKLHGQFGRSA